MQALPSFAPVSRRLDDGGGGERPVCWSVREVIRCHHGCVNRVAVRAVLTDDRPLPPPEEPMSDIPLTPDSPSRRVPKWAKWTAIGLVAAVALFFGAIFLYAKVINDAPDEFSSDDLGEVLAGAAVPAGGSVWAATDASEVGYRVEEVLFGVNTTAVGRTNAVTGSLTIEGTQVTTTEFTVDVATITSPESKRDAQFRGRIMSTDEFPTATFVLTQPIELGAEPAEGLQVTVPATGELTLRGVTQPVTFDVTALLQNGLIGVQGAIPVVFADYAIQNPSISGITTEDNGLVEFILVFAPG
jgi:polyisoprenoid-binding protein YceI